MVLAVLEDRKEWGMPIKKILQEAKKFEVQVYQKPKNSEKLRETHIPFSGAPRKHPSNPDKVLLIVDPYGSSMQYYEFWTEDISYAEELPNIVTLDGESISMGRIWVRKKSLGVRCTPFLVEDLQAFAK
jgi:hypothetical protein